MWNSFPTISKQASLTLLAGIFCLAAALALGGVALLLLFLVFLLHLAQLAVELNVQVKVFGVVLDEGVI